jgi:hypothetical protein
MQGHKDRNEATPGAKTTERLTDDRAEGSHRVHREHGVSRRRGPWRSLEAASSRRWNGWTGSTTGGSWEPIGTIAPAEVEERSYAMLEQPAMAA